MCGSFWEVFSLIRIDPSRFFKFLSLWIFVASQNLFYDLCSVALTINLKLQTENIEVNIDWVDWFDGEKAYKCVDSLSCLGKIGEVF